MGSIYEKRNKKKMSQLLWSWCGFIKMLTKQNLQRGQGHSGLGQRPYLWRACSVTQWISWFRLMRFFSGLVMSFLFWVLSTYTKEVENISKNNTKLPKLCHLYFFIWWFWNQKRTNHSLVQFSLMWLCVVHPDVYWQETVWVFSFLYKHMGRCPGEELDLHWNNARGTIPENVYQGSRDNLHAHWLKECAARVGDEANVIDMYRTSTCM